MGKDQSYSIIMSWVMLGHRVSYSRACRSGTALQKLTSVAKHIGSTMKHHRFRRPGGSFAQCHELPRFSKSFSAQRCARERPWKTQHHSCLHKVASETRALRAAFRLLAWEWFVGFPGCTGFNCPVVRLVFLFGILGCGFWCFCTLLQLSSKLLQQ